MKSSKKMIIDLKDLKSELKELLNKDNIQDKLNTELNSLEKRAT